MNRLPSEIRLNDDFRSPEEDRWLLQHQERRHSELVGAQSQAATERCQVKKEFPLGFVAESPSFVVFKMKKSYDAKLTPSTLKEESSSTNKESSSRSRRSSLKPRTLGTFAEDSCIAELLRQYKDEKCSVRDDKTKKEHEARKKPKHTRRISSEIQTTAAPKLLQLDRKIHDETSDHTIISQNQNSSVLVCSGVLGKLHSSREEKDSMSSRDDNNNNNSPLLLLRDVHPLHSCFDSLSLADSSSFSSITADPCAGHSPRSRTNTTRNAVDNKLQRSLGSLNLLRENDSLDSVTEEPCASHSPQNLVNSLSSLTKDGWNGQGKRSSHEQKATCLAVAKKSSVSPQKRHNSFRSGLAAKQKSSHRFHPRRAVSFNGEMVHKSRHRNSHRTMDASSTAGNSSRSDSTTQSKLSQRLRQVKNVWREKSERAGISAYSEFGTYHSNATLAGAYDNCYF
jgi:hypothetical protein